MGMSFQALKMLRCNPKKLKIISQALKKHQPASAGAFKNYLVSDA